MKKCIDLVDIAHKPAEPSAAESAAQSRGPARRKADADRTYLVIESDQGERVVAVTERVAAEPAWTLHVVKVSANSQETRDVDVRSSTDPTELAAMRRHVSTYLSSVVDRVAGVLGCRKELTRKECAALEDLQDEIASVSLAAQAAAGPAPFANANAITDVLRYLRDSGEGVVTSLRYYHFRGCDSTVRMVSVDSLGLSDAAKDSEDAIRSGGIERYLSECPLAQAESFWCFKLRVPVLFHVHRAAPSVLRPAIVPTMIPIVETPVDHCEDMLRGVKGRVWIDFPVCSGVDIVGKLSCDVNEALLSKVTRDYCVRFAANVRAMAPHLDHLSRVRDSRARRRRRGEISREIAQCDTLDRLYEYCVVELPRRACDAQYSSLYLHCIDDSLCPSRRLILQRTSYDRLHDGELTSSYDVECWDGVTTWVARSSRPVRLYDLNQEDSRFQMQLAGYRHNGRSLAWTNRYPDSDRFKSLLVVPLVSNDGQLTGVLRAADKARGQRFTESDQQILAKVAARAICQRYRELVAEESHALLRNAWSRLNAVITRGLDDAAFNRCLSEVLQDIFPEGGRHGKKLFLCNRFSREDKSEFEHWIIGGSLAPRGAQPTFHRTAGSLTAYTEDRGQSVYINNMERAVKQGVLLPICEGPVCAIAAPIRHGTEVFGVVVVKSSNYDLNPDVDKQRIEFVAEHMGMAFALRRLQSW